IKEERLTISVGSSRLGGKIIELKQISKAFDQKIILKDFNYFIMKNDRIGIIGPNGSGKSTLLNIISGSLLPDRGLVDKGETVRIGLYSQEIQQPDGDLRVIEYIRETAEYLLDAQGNQISAAQMLENFLFSPSLQWTEIKKLSGGEQRRLALLKVLMDSPNILLLDEPTNDLDIETLAVLEDYLENFKGAVLSVSHDRYFLDRIAEKIFSFEGNGKVGQYFGNYSDYREMIDQDALEVQKKSEEGKPDPNQKKRRDKPLKLSFNEQKELENVLPAIAELEEKISAIDKKIDEAFSDHIQLQQLLLEKNSLEQQLQDRMDRWIYLSEMSDNIEKSNQ
ncbi:MAG: ABC-F family ATP-binding cassette domain-containing protein, partial [Peptococcaceae bacterium]|nr:ABC-F family ATP-binding cassette domain-containing protein [Peptococcaceae bacterium]